MYATVQNMIDEYGETEVYALSRSMAAQMDVAVLDKALARASDEINGYLGRFTLPLLTVPAQVTGWCCDIARYRLSGAEITETDPVRVRYKDALRDLGMVRDGKLSIGLTQAGIEPPSAGSVQFSSGARIFNAESLRGF